MILKRAPEKIKMVMLASLFTGPDAAVMERGAACCREFSLQPYLIGLRKYIVNVSNMP